jgi:PAS domain S-box-containing protein
VTVAGPGAHPIEEGPDVETQLAEALETLRAIRNGEVDALVVSDGTPGEQVFTLASADRPYRMFVESMREGAATVSQDGSVLYANRRLAELLGRPLSRIFGAPLSSFVVPADHARVSAILRPGTTDTVEVGLVGHAGKPLPVRIGASTAVVESEQLVYLTITDLTQATRARERLTHAHRQALEASRLKSEFVANMSHEIRTPLNGVLGMSRLLADTSLTEEQREYTEAMESSGRALLAVIDDVLDFSKIEAGKLELEEQPFALGDLVEEVCSLVAGPAHDKGVEVLAWVDEGLPATVSGDGNRVRQVLANLMTNAVKFTAAGEICISVKKDFSVQGPMIRFDVADTGIGIAEDSVSRIFDSFAQADGSTTREYGGTGLGLTISEQLVALMGGRIGVESLQDQGSTFWVTLPLPAVPAEAGAETTGSDLAGVRALVVDDNATSRALLERQLMAWGMVCEKTGDCGTALELLRAADSAGAPYKVVLLDAEMPATDESAALGAVRSSPFAREAAVIMLTSSRGGQDSASDAGAEDFVAKPVHRGRLHDAITRGLHVGAPGGSAPVRAAVHEGRAPDESLVLLAEDNPVNQLVAVKMLEKQGFRVDVADNGRIALDMWERDRYRAIFMDCQMPVLDGYGTTAEIRRREGADRRVPIVAMTASSMKGDRDRCLAAGMDDYIAKPVTPQAIRDAVTRVLAPTPTDQQDVPDEAPQVLDRAVLEDICDADPAVWQALVKLFDEQSKAALEPIGLAIAEGDAEGLEREAHKLKGSSASIGALRVASLSDRLCRSGREGVLTDAPDLLQQLEEALALTETALREPRSGGVT